MAERGKSDGCFRAVPGGFLPVLRLVFDTALEFGHFALTRISERV
jgi:hypothetical protein